MKFLYNIGVRLYGFGIRIASLFNPKAKKWLNGRKNYFAQLPEIDKTKKLYWFHCASLGEFDQGLPLMGMIKEKEPECTLLVTFFSPSGMDHYHKRKNPADHVLYLPLDTPKNAKRFIEYFNPAVTCFVKYEFWANYLTAAKNSGSKIYNISGIFRPDHRFFKSSGSYFREILRLFDWFFVQNEQSKELLNSIDITNATITGDSRFDKVIENRIQVKKDERLSSFCQNERAFIVGSSWPEDEAILLDYINASESKVIIAPHNIDEKHVKAICNQLKRSCVRYTEFEDGVNAEILVLDTIGQLSNAYFYGSLSYVGGGFSGSLHNILEPAVFGLPVIFGPKHSRFPEAQQFIDEGFGFSVQSSEALIEAIKKIEAHLDQIRQKEMAFIDTNAGASAKMYEHIISS